MRQGPPAIASAASNASVLNITSPGTPPPPTKATLRMPSGSSPCALASERPAVPCKGNRRNRRCLSAPSSSLAKQRHRPQPPSYKTTEGCASITRILSMLLLFAGSHERFPPSGKIAKAGLLVERRLLVILPNRPQTHENGSCWWQGRPCLYAPEGNQVSRIRILFQLTAILRGLRASVFGSETRSTPSRSSAWTLSTSTELSCSSTSS